ncbi:hypothetical protein AWB69_07598 [Caballeronia udeis]|uniref:Uncharacterized protein n=1 Tax=Caballeronia udeis TaxID=1232866 RepID=A0A158JDL1_9BURK|nr:hypothetical protein AWB69_07598 [Caballeronia udeis]
MIDGVVRVPSAFSITLTVLPSMIATHEFVVPRSIPMILPIFITLLTLIAAGPILRFRRVDDRIRYPDAQNLTLYAK